MGKSKRNSPKPGGNRAQRLAERRAALELQTAQAGARPFEGLAAECDLVALREFVPSATAPGNTVAGLVRVGEPPTGYVATQVQFQGPDPAADIAAAILWTQSAEPGESLTTAESAEGGPRLADVIDADAQLELTVHQDFDWWVPEGVQPDPQVAATIEQAKQAIMPSARLDLGADSIGAGW